MCISFQFVALTQPINALAFVFDGINYGASDFAYSAYSMVSLTQSSQIEWLCLILMLSNHLIIVLMLQVLVAIVSITCLIMLSSLYGFTGIWISLTIYMSLRMFAGFWR